MAVTHSTTARDAATNAVIALIGTSANLCFRLTGTIGSPGAIVATLPLTTPTSFGASSGGTSTAAAIASDTNATGNAGAVATASIQTSGAVIIIHCAVAANSSDINMSNGLTVAAGDTVSCSSLTYTALSA
jgi:hypothetical protein